MKYRFKTTVSASNYLNARISRMYTATTHRVIHTTCGKSFTFASESHDPETKTFLSTDGSMETDITSPPWSVKCACTALHRLHRTASHCTASHCTALCSTASYYTASRSHHIAPHRQRRGRRGGKENEVSVSSQLTNQ